MRPEQGTIASKGTGLKTGHYAASGPSEEFRRKKLPEEGEEAAAGAEVAIEGGGAPTAYRGNERGTEAW